MAYYLVMLKSKNLIARLDEEQLNKFKDGIERLAKKGSMKAAYTKVGGGLVFIVDVPNNAHLTVELRKHFITDADVIPLVPLEALLDAHIEHRQMGRVGV